ncbi:MAG TPA: hypothetical protein VMV28_07520 [Thermoplasmata archaeon]|nr:hypothetical protein [Thermoplasmata archaeon]
MPTVGSRPGRAVSRSAWTVLVVLAIGVAALAPAGTANATFYPPLPVFVGNHILGNLSGPTLNAGSSGTLSLTVQDLLPWPMSGIALTLDIYAMGSNAGPATPVGNSMTPLLTGTNGVSGSNITFPVLALAPRQVAVVTVPVTTSASIGAASFLLRTALGFTANGTRYLLESRGWFNSAVWQNATELVNGSATLNLAALGVSGVTPESSIIVQTVTWAWVVYGMIAGAIALVGLGAFFYFRRTGSSAGAKRSPGASQAPSALGKRRKSDGD